MEIESLTPQARAALIELSWRGHQTRHELARQLDLTVAVTADALTVLEGAGLVAVERRRYSPTRRGLETLEEHRERERERTREMRRVKIVPGELLGDAAIRNAVSGVVQRAERQPSTDYLSATFVDPGLSEQLQNPNNQIIYGRRGTGKTHVLKILANRTTAWPRSAATYLDLRSLGSSGIHEDTTRSMQTRVTHLLKDVLAEVHNTLMDIATSPELEPPGPALERLRDLEVAITRSEFADETRTVEHESSEDVHDTARVDLKLGPTPSLSLRAGGEHTAGRRARFTRQGTPEPHLHFLRVSRALEDALTACGVRNYFLLLDEWSAIPFDLQPWLADFLRRAFFTLTAVTVKIGSLEYRSNWAAPQTRNNLIGFELGADISAPVELDDYFVFDRNRQHTEKLFAELLYRHLAIELEVRRHADRLCSVSRVGCEYESEALRMAIAESLVGEVVRSAYLAEMHNVSSSAELLDRLFATRAAFRELVQAGEGVARDFLNIFYDAYFEAVRRDLKRIDVRAVRAAAREFFERQKSTNMDDWQNAALDHILERVLAEGQARTFLLERRHERDALIRALFDFRVIHLVQRGFMDVHSPGRRLNVYTLDYGFYAHLLDTPKAPTDDFTSRLRGRSDAVELGRDRWIKRIVLRPDAIREAVTRSVRDADAAMPNG